MFESAIEVIRMPKKENMQGVLMKTIHYTIQQPSNKRRIYRPFLLGLLVLVFFIFSCKKPNLHNTTTLQLDRHQKTEDRIQKLLKHLKSSSSRNERQHAIEKLGHLGHQAKQAISALITASKDPDPYIRWYALLALFRIDPSMVQSFQILPMLTMDSDWMIREAVIQGISRLKQKHFFSVLRTMAQSINKQSLKKQRRMLEVIQRLGPKAETILTDLEQMLDNASIELHQHLAVAIASLGKQALPVLIRQFKKTTDVKKASIIQSFGYMEPFAKNLLPFLLESLQSFPKNKQIVLMKHECFNNNFPFGLPKLNLIFNSSTRGEYSRKTNRCIITHTAPVYVATLRSLKKFGPRAFPAIPLLLKLFYDPSFMEQHSILHVLISMGKEARIILPELQNIQKLKEFSGKKLSNSLKKLLKKLIDQIQEEMPQVDRPLYKFQQR